MRIQAFQVALVEKTRQRLPRALKNFEPRSFFAIVKIFYRDPRLHYEVWVRGKEHLIEIGLHLEATQATNDALRTYLDARSLEIHDQLGARVEIERWTNAWSRVHEIVPYESLDAELVERLAVKLAKMIVVLQPMVEEFQGA
jgi:hypothetical protein